MNTSLDLDTLFANQDIPQGQLKILQRIRFSLGNIWSTLSLEHNVASLAIAFSACSRGEGASFVALHMALLLSHENELKTLYVDADLEKSRRKREEPLPGEAHEGLYHFLTEEKKLDELIKPSSIPKLDVLSSGIQNGKPPSFNLQKQTKFVDLLLEKGRKDYDAVVLDIPPLSMSPWALTVGKAVDSAVIVCRYATSRRQVCMHGLQKVEQHNIPLSGMILNERDYPIPMSIYNWLK